MAKLKFTNSEFTELKQKAEDAYKNLLYVKCPYLDREVAFNAKGLDHIKLKEWNKARSRSDQYVRLKLLHLAPEVLKKSHSVQGVESGNRFERVKVNSRWDTKMTHVTYFEFIAVIKKCRVRVIVKQIENTQPYFWSIIPYWKQNKFCKKLFDGNPEID